jgi:hypothetical protein
VAFGLAALAGIGHWSLKRYEHWQAMRLGASDTHLNDQVRWLSQTVQASLNRALEDAHDVSVSEGRHLPRSPGLLGIAWIEETGVRFAWSDIDRPRVLSARVEAVESLRKELLLAFSDAPVPSDEPVLLPLSTAPLFNERAEQPNVTHASRWLAVRIKPEAGRTGPPVVALLDSARLFPEVPESRSRSLGGVYRIRVVEASTLAVLAASEPSDLAPRFRAGSGPSVSEAPEGWVPTPGILPVLRDFLSLGRVASLGTHDGVRVKVQRTPTYPLLVMAEQHPEGSVLAGIHGAKRKPAAQARAGGFENPLILAAVGVFLMGFLGFAGIWVRRRLRAQAWAHAASSAALPAVELSAPLETEATIPGFPELESEAEAEWGEPHDMGSGAMAAGRPVFTYEPQTPAVAAGHEVETLRRENDFLRQEVERLRHAQEALLQNQELSRRTLEELREEEKLLQDFETGALVQRHPRVIAEQAVRTAHRLCRTPSLFFSVEPTRGSARLVADSGLPDNGRAAPASLEFQLEDEALETIAKIARDGSIASLSHYEPLARIMLLNFGVSHFEAWAVTGYSWLGRAAGNPSVLGILVLLQGSSQSLTQGRSLGRMLRNAGLVYENSLLAR